jgi:hypothetical protein
MRLLIMDEAHIKARKHFKEIYNDPVKRKYIREQANKWNAEHPDNVKAMRERFNERHPGELNKKKNDWQKRNPEKARAKVYAQRYVPLKDKCEWCPETKGLGRHHPDYSKPLEVLTLCPKCHKKAKEIRVAKIDNNRHCDTCAFTFPCGRGAPSFKGRPCTLWVEKKLIEKKTGEP